MRFCIVLSNLALGDKIGALLTERFAGRGISIYYRSYHFENYEVNQPALVDDATKERIAWSKPDLIISDGTCKNRDEYGQSVSIWYSEPREWAKEQGIPFISPTFFGVFFLRLFLFKLWLFSKTLKHLNTASA